MAYRKGTFDHDCIFSTVRNTSGVTRKFGFLPPHGVELAANAEYTVFGSILETLGGQLAGGGHNRRSQRSFLKALDRQDMLLLMTPRPVFKDAVSGLPKMQSLSSGTFSVVDPCWKATSDATEKVPA